MSDETTPCAHQRTHFELTDDPPALTCSDCGAVAVVRAARLEWITPAA